jgi:hypothetical protein
MKTMKEQTLRAAALTFTFGIIIIALSIVLMVQGCGESIHRQPCTVTSTSTGATITCTDGTTATILNGTNGSPGINGINASSDVSIVQLCPGFTPSYPQVFPESALCIDNQLWGVYSANGGFGLLMPPGQYASTGVNASCNLTIGANCEVTIN